MFGGVPGVLFPYRAHLRPQPLAGGAIDCSLGTEPLERGLVDLAPSGGKRRSAEVLTR